MDDLQKLQEFLLKEFPLELSEGDNMIEVSMRLMKDMKAQIGRHAASEMVLGGAARRFCR